MSVDDKVILITRQTSEVNSVEEEILNNAGFKVMKKAITDEEELINAAKQVDGIICGSREPFTERVLGSFERCRIISRYGIGVDNIDVSVATKNGVLVTNVPDASSREVAEHTVSLMLVLARKIVLMNKTIRSNQWKKRRSLMSGTRKLSKLTAGIVGFGRIGRNTWKYVTALGMDAVVYDSFIKPDAIQSYNAKPVSFNQLLTTSDFVVLHVPGSDKPLISSKELALMKKTAYLVNSSRGNLVDEEALIKVLEDGEIAGAALDVTAKEPTIDNPLMDFENVILTGHTAFYSDDAEEMLSTETAQAMIDLFSGKLPRNIVNETVVNEI